jgi:hypothetical protein
MLAAGHAVLAASVADIGTTGPIGLLAPALLLIGAGMGLVITPLTATVLAGLEPQRAGAASGALATMQQVGNALGVAVTGVLFFGALDGGFGPDPAAAAAPSPRRVRRIHRGANVRLVDREVN